MKNLPHQTLCNLERAHSELLYYAERCRARIGRSTPTTENARALARQVNAATPETAGKLFTKAWHLCRDMEAYLKNV